MIMPDFNSYTNNSVNKDISNGTWIYPYPSYTTEYYNGTLVDNVIDQMIKCLPKDTTLKKEDKKVPENRKDNNDMFNFGNFFNGMFAPIKDGCCKMAMNGKIAIKTSNGYKTFDVKTKRLVNCDNFAFDMPNMFWMVPTMSVKTGDIIMVNGKPKAVLSVSDGYIETFSYEDSTIDKTVVETHVWMGKKYCYGKIVSPFGNMMATDNGMESMMKMMMFSQMFGNGSNSSNNFNPMMFMLMGGKDFSIEDMFGDMFNFDSEEEPKEDK